MIRKGGGLAIIYITLDLWILTLNGELNVEANFTTSTSDGNFTTDDQPPFTSTAFMSAQTTESAITSLSTSIYFSPTESLASTMDSSSALPTVSIPFSLTTTRKVSDKQTITTISSSAFTLVSPSAVATDLSLSNLTTSLNVSFNQTTINGTTVINREGLHLSLGSTIGVFLAVVVMVTAGTMLLVYWRKKGMNCYQWKTYLPVRKRRSSTSSHGPLTTDDATFVTITEPPQERELFSIEDKDGGQNGRRFSSRKQSTDDDYFYDEIFEKSAFVDAATNRANKHLTVDDEVDDDDELTVPDLVFKTPTKF